MLTRKVAGLLAGVAVVLTLTACGPTLETGEVTQRDHTSPGCTTTLVAMPNGSGGTMMIPQTNCWPESWNIQLRNCDSGECNLDTRSVSQREYEACAVGDRYPECVTGAPSKAAW